MRQPPVGVTSLLSEFTPADELRIKGLQNRYRQRGIGAPLAADAAAPSNEKEFHVAPDVKVPVTALLRIDLSRRNLAQGHLRGNIDVYPAFEPSSVTIRGQSVPLEVDTSAAFAYGLSDPEIWRSEFGGFLSGDYFDNNRSPLDGLEPYRPGQIPVVFIHGTASSSGRWADLVNDLQSDPTIREHFQFWWFSYSTGNPAPFSALRLRTAIEDALHKIDPQGRDPALRQIVLIGHSQGGLLAKMLVINSGSRIWDAFSSKPLEQLNVSAETRDLRRSRFRNCSCHNRADKEARRLRRRDQQRPAAPEQDLFDEIGRQAVQPRPASQDNEIMMPAENIKRRSASPISSRQFADTAVPRGWSETTILWTSQNCSIQSFADAVRITASVRNRCIGCGAAFPRAPRIPACANRARRGGGMGAPLRVPQGISDPRNASPSGVRHTATGGAARDFHRDAAARQLCRRFHDRSAVGAPRRSAKRAMRIIPRLPGSSSNMNWRSSRPTSVMSSGCAATSEAKTSGSIVCG